MATIKARQGLIRSSFVSLLIFSMIMTTLLQFRHPTSWKYFYATKRTFAREVSDSDETTPSLPTVEAYLRATLHSDKLKSSSPVYSQLQNSNVSNTETTAEVDSDEERVYVKDNEGDFYITLSQQQKDALFRPRDSLEADKPFWQSVDDAMDVLTYSAHFDDVEKPPVIRVIGVARDPLPYSDVTCRYYGCLHCPVMHSVPSSVVYFRNRNGRRYIGAWVLCPLPAHDQVFPFALSVHKEEQSAGTRPVPIHYSNSTHARLSIRVQRLLKQRNIILKEGDVDTFSAVWKYVRNEEVGGQDTEDPGLKLLLPGSQGDTSGVNSKDENGKQLLVISETSQVERVENKKNETGTIFAAQNYKSKIFMNSSGDGDMVKTRLQTDTLHDDKNTNTKTPSKGVRNDPLKNNTPDRNQGLTINSDRNSGRRGTVPEGYRWNVTRCFPAFQRKFDNHVLLAEMVAASRALGVDHFVFYVESVGPLVNITLQVLQFRGLAEVLPWNLHMREREVFYKGQFPAIQDCLYRQLRSSRYVLTGDVDELFVPKTSGSLVPLLDRWFGKKPNCGSFQFLNSFCNINLPPVQPSQVLGKPPTPNTITSTIINKTITNSTLTSGSNYNHTNNKHSKNNTTTNNFTDNNNNHDKKSNNNINNAFTDIDNNNKHNYNNDFHSSNIPNIDPTIYSMAMQYQLPIFLHSLRHVQILKPGKRSKIALDPRKVLVGSVHLVDKLRKGFRSCVMSEQEGLLHHYRALYGTKKVPVVDDNSVRVYGATYVQEAVAILKEVEEMEKTERDRKSLLG